MTPLALLALSIAWAGDPCPIDVDVAAVTPPWRDRSADLGSLQSKRTWLGLSWRTSGGGVRITAIGAGSPAEEQGIRVGDQLVQIGGAPVHDTASTNAAFDAVVEGATIPVRVRRGEDLLDFPLAPGAADPLVLGLVAAAGAQECRSSRLLTLDEAQTQAVLSGVFDGQRGFRCADAHHAIKGLPAGSLVVVRGGSRVLLTTPGWASTCVGVASVDGEALTPQRLEAVLEPLLEAYVQDRHANP
jgi:membrane-associated protease RseP (regulator of RpoE activity)